MTALCFEMVEAELLLSAGHFREGDPGFPEILHFTSLELFFSRGKVVGTVVNKRAEFLDA